MRKNFPTRQIQPSQRRRARFRSVGKHQYFRDSSHLPVAALACFAQDFAIDEPLSGSPAKSATIGNSCRLNLPKLADP
jgi:hypothetical protein